MSEFLIFATINSYYTTFCLDSIIYRDKRTYIAGCNISNVLVFTPWLFMNIAGLSYALYGWFFAKNVGKGMALLVCLGSGVLGTFILIAPYNEFSMFYQFVFEILVQDMSLIIYMALVLVIGLLILNEYSSITQTFILRKGFHFLAFVLFVPPIIFAKFDKPRMIVFAFNSVSVLLILIEVVRYSESVFS